MPVSGPVILETRLGASGYWIVTVSVSPGRRISVMIAKTGITPTEAGQLALLMFPAVRERG